MSAKGGVHYGRVLSPYYIRALAAQRDDARKGKMKMQVISSAVGSAAFTAAVVPPSGDSWENLAWSVLSAVLASVLSWLAGRTK